MKQINLILCLLISYAAIAQNKKDNAIIIRDAISTQKIIEVLFNNGYVIDTKESNYIATKEKQIKTATLKLSFLLTDTTIILRGYGNMNIEFTGKYSTTKSPSYDVYFGGMKGSPMLRAWQEMDRVAKALRDSVEYIKQ